LMSVYFATKHYVLAFSEWIAEEWEDFWVQVIALCPGPTETRFVNAANAWNNKMFSKKLPTAREVAQFWYDSLIGGKRVAIHGFINRVTAHSVRFMPRNLVTKMVKMMQEK
jgi:short-subunit dehydrogenase